MLCNGLPALESPDKSIPARNPARFFFLTDSETYLDLLRPFLSQSFCTMFTAIPMRDKYYRLLEPILGRFVLKSDENL